MKDQENKFSEAWYQLYRLTILLAAFVVLISSSILSYGLFGDQITWFDEPVEVDEREYKRRLASRQEEDNTDKIENGIHVETGLIYAEGFDMVRGNCTACHSPKLITQNRATRDGWKEMITWMQETQGLWDLGKNESVILDYLAANYAPEEIGRRPGLDMEAVEWYILDLEN